MNCTIEGDGVALVELNRPKKRNALSQVMIDQISSTLQSLDKNSNVRAVVLTGAAPDGPFCGMNSALKSNRDIFCIRKLTK